MNYNLKAINANKQLQSSLGLQADGLWGDNSQLIYNCTNKKLGFNWVKLRSHFGNFNQSQVNGFNAILDAIVMAVSGFRVRIIKQPKIGVKR